MGAATPRLSAKPEQPVMPSTAKRTDAQRVTCISYPSVEPKVENS